MSTSTIITGDDAPSLSEQISELQRELKMRKTFYPKQTKSGRLSSSKAWTQTRNMSAALKTLLWLQQNSEAVRATHHQIKQREVA